MDPRRDRLEFRAFHAEQAASTVRTRRYDASQWPATYAVELLKEQGLVVTVPGLGTYINQR